MIESYTQNEKAAASTVKRKISAPELASFTVAATPMGTSTIEITKSLTATPLAKPSGLKALNFKGLGFTRSRSAPPTPRDERPQVVPDKGDGTPATVPEGGSLFDETIYGVDDDAKSEARLERSDDIKSSYELQRSTNTSPVHPSLPLRAPDVPGYIIAPSIVRVRSSNGLIRAPIPVPATALPSLLIPPVTSRSSSPSLEQAIRAERMRRAASGAASTLVPKGARFKSSPLTGERSGVVVADKVRHQLGEAEGRIGSEREKEGPDKEWW